MKEKLIFRGRLFAASLLVLLMGTSCGSSVDAVGTNEDTVEQTVKVLSDSAEDKKEEGSSASADTADVGSKEDEDQEDAIVEGLSVQEGTYADASQISSVILHDGNLFTLIPGDYYDVHPTGTFSVEEGNLLLTAEDGQIFRFQITEDGIVYDSDGSKATFPEDKVGGCLSDGMLLAFQEGSGPSADSEAVQAGGYADADQICSVYLYDGNRFDLIPGPYYDVHPSGSFAVKGDMLLMTAEDGQFFCFLITEDGLVYERESSVVTFPDDEVGGCLSDGMLLLFQGDDGTLMEPVSTDSAQ